VTSITPSAVDSKVTRETSPSPVVSASSITNEAASIPGAQANASPVGTTPGSVQDPRETERLNAEGPNTLSGKAPDEAAAQQQTLTQNSEALVPHYPPPAGMESPQEHAARERTKWAQQHTSTAGETPQSITNDAVTPGTPPTSSGQEVSRYADVVQRKIQQDWLRGLVDSQTPKGAQTIVGFTIRPDGMATDVEIVKSSGSPSLDRECLRAARLHITFGIPPSSAINGHFTASCDY
jgi:protein TonB